ncbi:MAG: SLC13 family permease [Nitrososphaerota archaeon]
MDRKALAYPIIPVGSLALSLAAGLSPQQSVAVGVFTGIIGGTLLFWRFRLAFALVGVSMLMAARLIDVPTFIEFSSLDVIVFLICMMIVIGFLEERRFFEVVVDRVLGIGRGSALRLMFVFLGMAALSAALVDEVTSILFMMSTGISLAARFQLPLKPLMLMTVFATNIGSSATVVGNPIGVLIALNSGYGFSDFLRYSAPAAALATVAVVLTSSAYFRDFFAKLNDGMKREVVEEAARDGEERSRIDRTAALVFLGVIAGLVLHAQIEALLGLKKNTMLIGVAMIGAGVVLLIEGPRARELVEKRVDWWTLTFFMLFFASVGTLHYTGVTKFIADALGGVFGSNPVVTLPSFYVVTGLMSAFMDNVLAVAFWVPVVQEMGAAGLDTRYLWWTMLKAGTYMGNLTLIGSTANIVAVGMAERQKLVHITFKEWIKPGILIGVLPTSAVALLWLIGNALLGA